MTLVQEATRAFVSVNNQRYRVAETISAELPQVLEAEATDDLLLMRRCDEAGKVIGAAFGPIMRPYPYYPDNPIGQSPFDGEGERPVDKRLMQYKDNWQFSGSILVPSVIGRPHVVSESRFHLVPVESTPTAVVPFDRPGFRSRQILQRLEIAE